DPDGDPVSYSAVNLPPGATLDPAAGVLRWTPNVFQAGLYPGVVLRATDGNLTASQTVTIQVDNANQPPVLVPLAPQSGREGSPLQFTLAASDVDGDKLTFVAPPNLPPGAQFDTTTGRFLWTPGYDQAGDYSLQFGARDPAGLTDTTAVLIHVANVDRPP